MKFISISIGTRGDMEPFLAIGEILQAKGHRVICAFPEQFRKPVEESNMEFASLGKRFIEMLESNIGIAALGGNGLELKKILAHVRLAKSSIKINKELIHTQYELFKRGKPDRVLYNGKSIYPIIWELCNSGKTILISPVPYMHYVKNHAHIAFNSNYGTFIDSLHFIQRRQCPVHFLIHKEGKNEIFK